MTEIIEKQSDIKNLIEEEYNKYYQMLHKSAYLYLKNREDAEDIVQDTFLDFFKNREKFRNQSSLYTYLYSIMMNKIKKYYFKKKYFNFFKRSVVEYDLKHRNPVEDFETKKIIKKSINSLSLKYKSVLILRYYENLSYEEISNILYIKLGTVKSRLWKACKLLKKSMERYDV